MQDISSRKNVACVPLNRNLHATMHSNFASSSEQEKTELIKLNNPYLSPREW